MLSVLSSDPPSLVVVSVVAGCALFSTLLLLLLLRHVLCCHWRHKHAPSPVDSVEMTAPGSTSGSPSRTLPLMRYSSDCLPKGAARVALSGGRRQRGVTCGCGEGSCAHQDAQEHHSRAGSKCSRGLGVIVHRMHRHCRTINPPRHPQTWKYTQSFSPPPLTLSHTHTYSRIRLCKLFHPRTPFVFARHGPSVHGGVVSRDTPCPVLRPCLLISPPCNAGDVFPL